MGNRNISYLDFRDELLKRYNHRCANCGSENDLQIHHIVPISVGGKDVITNLVPLCRECHLSAHHGRNLTEYKRSKGRLNGGRQSKIDFEKFDVIFQKFIDGKIGKKVFCELTGYKRGLSTRSNPNLLKSMNLRGISEIKNTIDVNGVSGNLYEGKEVGFIVYDNGKKKKIYFHDTGDNTVEYKARGSGAGAGHCVQYIEPEKKPRKRSSKKAENENQLSILDFVS